MARVWCSNDKAQHGWYVNLQYLYVVSSVIRVVIPIPIPILIPITILIPPIPILILHFLIFLPTIIE